MAILKWLCSDANDTGIVYQPPPRKYAYIYILKTTAKVQYLQEHMSIFPVFSLLHTVNAWYWELILNFCFLFLSSERPCPFLHYWPFSYLLHPCPDPQICKPAVALSFHCRRAFAVRTPKLWNNLPSGIRQATQVSF